MVEAYEKLHYPIAKPTIGELISLSIEEKGMTQKQLANELGVSPSRVSDYISGRAEPTLRIARAICLLFSASHLLPCLVSEQYLYSLIECHSIDLEWHLFSGEHHGVCVRYKTDEILQ